MESLKSGIFAAAALCTGSLFIQCIHWVIFEKAAFASSYLWFTPLVICLMYKLLTLDSKKEKGISKLFVFGFGVALPLVISLAVSIYMIVSYPDLSVFSDTVQESGTARETIALYSGRMVLTSVYLAIFAGLNLVFEKVHGLVKK